MPRYDFRCRACGRVTEQVQGYDVTAVPCSCGAEAERAAVYAYQSIRGETVPKGNASRNILDKHGRARTPLFDEATQEWDYNHQKAEVDQERSLPAPSAWKMAKAAVRKRGADGYVD